MTYLQLDKRLEAFNYLDLANKNGSKNAQITKDKYFPPNLLVRDYINKSKELLMKNDYSGALVCYNKIIEIYPLQPSVYLKRAEIKLKLNDKIGACEDWNNALKLGEDKAIGYINENCNE